MTSKQVYLPYIVQDYIENLQKPQWAGLAGKKEDKF